MARVLLLYTNMKTNNAMKGETMNQNWRKRRVRLWVYKNQAEIDAELTGIADRHGWLDDNWPDMMDDMVVWVMDNVPEVTEQESEKIVNKFLNIS